MELAEAMSRTGWIEDPVHPSTHSMAKMALHLTENLMGRKVLLYHSTVCNKQLSTLIVKKILRPLRL